VLADAVNQPLSEILAALTELEIEGLVACENGRWVACAG
jgi:DNA processing protein